MAAAAAKRARAAVPEPQPFSEYSGEENLSDAEGSSEMAASEEPSSEPEQDVGPGILAEADAEEVEEDEDEEDEEDEDGLVLGSSEDGSDDGDASTSDSEEEPSGQGGKKAKGASGVPRTGPSGEKLGFEERRGPSLARAFGKIMSERTSKVAAAKAAPILAGSRSVAAAVEEGAAEAEARRAAKRRRLDIKQRGHVGTLPRKGDDPAHDAREKALARLATRGVVLLFNAVHKAQKQQVEATTAARKAVKMSRASFLAQLRAGDAAASGAGASGQGAVTGAGADGSAAVGMVAGATGQAAGAGGAATGGGAAGWKVLQQGFTGLAAGGKMKDWARRGEEDEEEGPDADQLEGDGSGSEETGSDDDESSGGDDAGW